MTRVRRDRICKYLNRLSTQAIFYARNPTEQNGAEPMRGMGAAGYAARLVSYQTCTVSCVYGQIRFQLVVRGGGRAGGAQVANGQRHDRGGEDSKRNSWNFSPAHSHQACWVAAVVCGRSPYTLKTVWQRFTLKLRPPNAQKHNPPRQKASKSPLSTLCGSSIFVTT